MDTAKKARAAARHAARIPIPKHRVKRELSETERADQYRRLQRRRALNEIEAEAHRRHANIDEWAAAERRRIRATYAKQGVS